MLFKSIGLNQLTQLSKNLVAGGGVEPPTSRLWALQATTALPRYICTQREIRTPNREIRKFLFFRLNYLGKLYSKEDSNPYFKIRNNVMDIVMFISLAFFRLNY